MRASRHEVKNPVSSDVCVLGGSAVRFTRRRDGSSWRDWVREAGLGALEDAGVEARDVDAVVVGTESDFFSLQIAPAPVVAAELGLDRCETMRAESGGASGAAAVRAAHALVASGLARCVLVVGFETVAGHLGGDDVRMLYGMSFDAEVEGFAGATPAALYALSMRMHMARHGTTAEQLAAVAVRNRANAGANPLAHKPMRIGVSDVLASPVVALPYRRLDCSLLSDGAAAVVVAGATRAPSIDRPRVRIAGSGAATDCPRLGDRVRPDRFDAKARAARDACAMAGVRSPADEIDCAEVYDAFSGAQVQALEDKSGGTRFRRRPLGLASEGAGGAACEAGEFDRDGRLPVNLSGGLLGQGGAPGATGVVQAMTVQRLLEGRYFEGAQPRRALRRGIVDTHGGVCTSAVVQVFEAVE